MNESLRAQRIEVRHRGAERDSLRDVSLALVPGEVLALVGPNGSGKSTALAALGRALRPRNGLVKLGEADAWALGRRAFARRVARLAQRPEHPLGLRVDELVALGRNPHRSLLRGASEADRRALESALAALELGELRARPVETLSGGERQRAWLAVALCQEAEILLLDEPTAALDLRHQFEVLQLLRKLNQDRGTTLAVVLHDLEHAAALAHRVAIMQRGRLYSVGAPERVIDPVMLRDVYGVDARISKEDGFVRVRVLGPADPMRLA